MYDQLIKALAAFRNKNGQQAANEIIKKHGGTSGLASVPNENHGALAQDLGLTVQTVKRYASLDDPKLHAAAWSKFNNPPETTGQ
jgi:hypothetical protein